MKVTIIVAGSMFLATIVAASAQTYFPESQTAMGSQWHLMWETSMAQLVGQGFKLVSVIEEREPTQTHGEQAGETTTYYLQGADQIAKCFEMREGGNAKALRHPSTFFACYKLIEPQAPTQ